MNDEVGCDGQGDHIQADIEILIWLGGYANSGISGVFTFAMASKDGKKMLDDSPENSPATPIMAMTNHFCFCEKMWYGGSGSATTSAVFESSNGFWVSCRDSVERESSKGFSDSNLSPLRMSSWKTDDGRGVSRE